MPILIQVSCHSRKTAKNMLADGNEVGIPTRAVAHFANLAAEPAAEWCVDPAKWQHLNGSRPMFGKIAGALLGRRLAGSNSGTKGALIGLGAAALARRSVPALAAVAALGWGFNKLRERRARRSATFPGDATPGM